jgi:hypothetical protein
MVIAHSFRSTVSSMSLSTSTPVPSLFKHAGPPPPLPLLTSQTEIAYDPIRHYTITAHEEISSGSQIMRHHSVPPVSRSKSIVRFQSLPPDHQHDNNASQYSESSLSSLSSVSSDSESEASDDLDEEPKKIPKPPGEAGRPGRGGYTLRVVLDWNPADYKKVSVCESVVSALAELILAVCRITLNRK